LNSSFSNYAGFIKTEACAAAAATIVDKAKAESRILSFFISSTPLHHHRMN